MSKKVMLYGYYLDRYVLTEFTAQTFRTHGINPALLNVMTRNPDNQSYIVRAPNNTPFAENLYGDSNKQYAYGCYQHFTVMLGVILLKLELKKIEAPLTLFRTIVEFARHRRREIAERNDQHNAPNLGEFRIKEYETDCTRTYKEIAIRFPLIYQENTERFTKEEFGQDVNGRPNWLKFRNDFEWDKRTYEGNGFVCQLSSAERLKIETLYHAKSGQYEQIESSLAQLFFEGIGTKSIDQLHEVCGKLFWIICAIKPFIRGDPSIAETIIKILYEFHGYQVPAWKTGIIPWVEATLIFTPEAFPARMLEIMDGKFIKSNTEEPPVLSIKEYLEKSPSADRVKHFLKYATEEEKVAIGNILKPNGTNQPSQLSIFTPTSSDTPLPPPTGYIPK